MKSQVGIVTVHKLIAAMAVLCLVVGLAAVDAGEARADVIGTISGTITDEVTGEPLEDIVVTAFWVLDDIHFSGTRTDSNGSYTLDITIVGEYEIRFRDYDDKAYEEEWFDDVPDDYFATHVMVASGDALTIDVDLTPIDYTIHGVVSNSSGSPLAGIDVTVYADYLRTVVVDTDTSAGDGSYLVVGSGLGNYMTFDDPTSTYGDHHEYVSVPAGGRELDMTLYDAASVAGRAVTELGDPIEGLEVRTGASEDPAAVTAADGSYRIDGLEFGAYSLYFSDPNGWHLAAPNDEGRTYGARISVDLAEGEDATNADITMILGVKMSGTVTDVSGGGLESATVSSVSWLSPQIATGGSGFKVSTDASGEWALTAYPGAYGLLAEYNDGVADYVGIQDGGEVPADRDWAQTELVSALGGTTVTGLDIAVLPQPEHTGEISGVITEPGTGDPVADVSLRVYDDTGDELISTDNSLLDGSFEIHVLPGDYLVYYYHEAPWWWHGASSPATADVITVGSGSVVDVSAEIPGTASVAGTVVDSVGATINGALVSIQDQTGRPIVTDRVYDHDPSYQMLLVGGTYDVEVSALGYGTERLEDQVFVAGTDYTLDFGLDEAGRITGTVGSRAGAFGLVTIELVDATGDVVHIDQQYYNAPYELRPPTDGPYFVRAYDLAGDLPDYGPVTYGDGSGPIAVAAVGGETLSGVDLELGDAASLDIELLDATGADLSAALQIRDADTLEVVEYVWVPSGHASLKLWPGEYLVGRDPYDNWFNPLQAQLMYEWYDDARTIDLAQRVVAAVDTATPIQIVYDDLSSIAGKITEASGAALPGAIVILRGEDDRFAGATIADSNGEYSWPVVVAGEWTVEVRHPSYATEWWQDSVSLGGARRLSVGPGEDLSGVSVVLGGADPQYPPPNLAPQASDASFSVDEDASIGAVVGMVAATDPEDDPLSFSISSGNVGGVFDIDDAGVVTVAAQLDYEAVSSFYLEVTVSDGDLDDTAWVSIDVGDVYEPPDNEAPVAEDASFSVDEDAALGSTVGTVDVSDPDLDSLSVSITAGNTGGAFAIDDDGQVTVAAQLDYESLASYTLTVFVSDGSLTDTATVTISVTDVVEPPDNTAPSVADAAFSVGEDAVVGSTVGIVDASDPDMDPLAFSITAGNSGGAFAIDSGGGITVAGSLDYETLTSYTLTVLVSDGFLTDEAVVTVTVTDVDEDPLPLPEFSDVDGNMFLADIEWLAQQGITKGCNPPINDLFCPNDFVTRGQMAAFLVRALGLTDPGSVDFVDDDGSVFEASIARLAAAGITKGCNPPDNTMFCPNDFVTRGQMAAFLVRALGLTDPGSVDFVDDDGSVFETSIARLAAAVSPRAAIRRITPCSARTPTSPAAKWPPSSIGR